MKVVRRSLYGATAVMAVPRRRHYGLAQPAVALRKCSMAVPLRFMPYKHRSGTAPSM